MSSKTTKATTKPTTSKPSEAPTARPTSTDKTVQIKAPNLQIAEFHLVGDAPLVTNRFANKAQIMATQSAGAAGKKGKAREAKDFTACYEAAKHISPEGWCGVHAGGFRAALISACRLVGYKMTLAKLSLFVIADGMDQDGLPIVRIHGEPTMECHHVRNDSGVIDIRARPMWRQWSLNLRVRYDADLFSMEDVANLLMRVGMQVGIGEGRPDSKDSAGMGWGTFTIAEESHERAAAE